MIPPEHHIPDPKNAENSHVGKFIHSIGHPRNFIPQLVHHWLSYSKLDGTVPAEFPCRSFQELSLLYQMNSDALDSLKADGVV